MSGLQATVIDGGMVDSPEKAAQTAEVLKSEDIEILFIFISTYALSSTILPIAQRIKIPVILLNIQPVAAINYDYINGLGDRGKMTGTAKPVPLRNLPAYSTVPASNTTS